ncbi:MAG: hypothetical protein WBV82_05375 [Myxococcaceae bacterium]
MPEEDLKRWVVGLYVGALSGLLVDSGFTAQTSPGEAIVLRRGEVVIEPQKLVSRYVGGELDDEGWSQSWREAGVADAPVQLRS